MEHSRASAILHAAPMGILLSGVSGCRSYLAYVGAGIPSFSANARARHELHIERLACDIGLAALLGCVLLFDFGGWFVIVHALTFAMRQSVLAGPLSCSFADPTNVDNEFCPTLSYEHICRLRRERTLTSIKERFALGFQPWPPCIPADNFSMLA